MEKIASYNELVARVKAKAAGELTQKTAAKQGDTVSDVTDPNLQGSVTPPTTAEGGGTLAARNTPESKDNMSTKGGDTLERNNAGVHKLGEGDQKPKQDPSGLPTDDIFAKTAKDLVAGIKAAFKTEEAPAETEEVASKKEAGERKDAEQVASAIDELTTDFHLKLASAMLATEEGRDTVRGVLAKAMSTEAVDKLIANCESMEKAAAEQVAAEQQFQEFLGAMTEEERGEFIKSANFHYAEVQRFEHDFEKAAYEQGAMDMGAMLGAEGGDPAAAGGLPPIPTEGGEPTIEEIIMILDELVQSGQLDPQLADAILMELTGAGGEGAPVDPAMAGAVDPAMAGGSPEEAAMMAEMGKVASAADEILAELEKEDS